MRISKTASYYAFSLFIVQSVIFGIESQEDNFAIARIKRVSQNNKIEIWRGRDGSMLYAKKGIKLYEGDELVIPERTEIEVTYAKSDTTITCNSLQSPKIIVGLHNSLLNNLLNLVKSEWPFKKRKKSILGAKQSREKVAFISPRKELQLDNNIEIKWLITPIGEQEEIKLFYIVLEDYESGQVLFYDTTQAFTYEIPEMLRPLKSGVYKLELFSINEITLRPAKNPLDQVIFEIPDQIAVERMRIEINKIQAEIDKNLKNLFTWKLLLGYFEKNRLYTEEEKLLNKMKAIFPNNEFVKKSIEDFYKHVLQYKS